MRIALLAWVCLFAIDAQSVKLTVRTAGDQTTFHIGEVIPLELSFTSDTPDSYQVNTVTSDRSGRLGLELCKVEPDTGWDDPLAVYFNAYGGGYIGGGMFVYQKLSKQPTVIHRALNQWVRFSQPGSYRLVVVSSRAGRVGSEFQGPPIEVSSNELSLTIVPAGPEWQAATLDRARSVLANQKGSPEAVATLRYLGTEAAAREMARGLSDQNAFQYKLGLASTPAKDAAMKIMHELLEDPDFPVNGLFLDTMSVVALPPGKAEDRWKERAELED